MPISSSVRNLVVVPATPIAVGDLVRWNQYRGEVLSVNGETAVIFERNNLALGHSVKWRMRLDALTKIPPVK
jgi:hypothetical protein